MGLVFSNRYKVGFASAIGLTGVYVFNILSAKKSPKKSRAVYKLATWNIAAINNNPFEYWITYDENPNYGKLMKDVETFIVNPGELDILVQDVFTDDMFQQLKAEMSAVGWDGVDEVEKLWESEYKNRKIVTEYLQDKTIGAKRLASMPDRVTNTINLADGGQVYRPTCINMYEGDLDNMEQWYSAWLEFMFHTTVDIRTKKGQELKSVHDLLLPIKRAKYPAVTEMEESICIPLQTLCGAVFDAILVHMLNTLAPSVWMPIKLELGNKLNKQKQQRTLEILEQSYVDSDIIFLQEVSAVFTDSFAQSTLPQNFVLKCPDKLDGKRDQNSMILLHKDKFSNFEEVTDIVLEFAESKIGTGDGDFFAVTCTASDGTNLLVASFHGDTNGLQTIPVTTALTRAMANDRFTECKLLFGCDANTYEQPNKKWLQISDFAEAYTGLGLTSCFGDQPDPTNYTTFNARTYLQPQLNKACKFNDRRSHGDVNPKDFILFHPEHFKAISTGKDNTGRQEYIEGIPFPTLEFPSDHGVLRTTLEML